MGKTVDTSRTEEVIASGSDDLGFDPETPSDGSRIVEFVQQTMGGKTETFRIEIKSSQRFTFGPFAPGSKGSFGGGDNALRIYEGATKDNQIAVFRNVESVRDISVKMVKMVKAVKAEGSSEKNAAGSSSESRIERSVEWAPLDG